MSPAANGQPALKRFPGPDPGIDPAHARTLGRIIRGRDDPAGMAKLPDNLLSLASYLDGPADVESRLGVADQWLNGGPPAFRAAVLDAIRHALVEIDSEPEAPVGAADFGILGSAAFA